MEYEQKGSDRAKCGDMLLKRLEDRLNTKGLNLTLLNNSRRFNLLYPQIGELCGKSPTSSDFSEGNIISATRRRNSSRVLNNFWRSCLFSHISEILTQDDLLARFTYMLQLPDKATLERFLEEEMKENEG